MAEIDDKMKELDSVDWEAEADQVLEEADDLKKKKDKNTIFTSFIETDQYILEQILSTTSPTHTTHTPRNLNLYILYNKEAKTSETVEEFKLDHKTYKPIESALVDKGSIKLPSGVEEYGTTAELIKEIKEYLNLYFEAPKFFELFLPYYILFTWVYMEFPFVAYLHFVGLTGTGKTVAAETVASLCYKPVDAAGSATISSIFRLADEWRGTIFLDEFDLSAFGKEGYRAVLTFLKTGVGDRALLRTEGEKNFKVKPFIVKAPKIFTSEKPVTDAGLQSRTFVIKMNKNTRRIPLFKLDNYYKKAESLRNKLLLWRLRNIGAVDLKKIEYGVDELKGFDRRVQQIITPIYYLSDEGTRKEIIKFAKIQEEETFRERRDSLEGQIFQVIVDAQPNEVTVPMIFEEINKENKYQISSKKIANVVRKILCFDIQRMGAENVSTIIDDKDRFLALCKYFGIATPLRGVCVGRVDQVGSGIGDQGIDGDLAEKAEKIFTPDGNLELPLDNDS